MGKLNFLLAEDYLKPKIYFQSKLTDNFNVGYSSTDYDQFDGLEHLTQMLYSPKAVIINAFQIDYYQSLPKLICKTLKESRSYKKLYIVGPELSLSILKRSSKTVYEKHVNDIGYINVERDFQDVFQQCLMLLKEGHILYLLPETSICWKPEPLQIFDDKFIPLCSTLLSQEANVPILCSSSTDNSNKITLHAPNIPNKYTGDFESRIYQQSESIYDLLEPLTADYLL